MKSRVLTNVFFAGIFILCQWSGSPAAAQSDSSSTDVQEKIRNDTVSVIKKGDELYLDVGFAQWQLYFTAPADCFSYDDRAALHFVKETDGRISGIRIDDRATLVRID